jgi:hypothetical protein
MNSQLIILLLIYGKLLGVSTDCNVSFRIADMDTLIHDTFDKFVFVRLYSYSKDACDIHYWLLRQHGFWKSFWHFLTAEE